MIIDYIKNVFICLLAIGLLVACSKDDDSAEEVRGNGVIYGKIIDEDNNDPIQGVSVTIYPGGKTTITGANGQYEFTGLSNGGYIVQVSKKGYLSKVESLSVTSSDISNQADAALRAGNSCLNIMLGELDFGDNNSSKAFVISNVGNKAISWHLYSDYHSFLSFDMTEGTLDPSESVAVNVNLLRMGTSAELNSFPIYIYAEGEEMGAIATVNRHKGGLFDSLLVGTWTMQEHQFWQTDMNDFTYNRIVSENGGFITINNDFSFERYERQFINNGIDNVDNMFSYNFESGEYSYDEANAVVQFGEYGNIYRINKLTQEYLELETPQFKNQKEGELIIYKRWKE